jgi:glyoxylase I family protein
MSRARDATLPARRTIRVSNSRMEATMSLSTESANQQKTNTAKTTGFIQGFHGVRYQSHDVGRAVEFYTRKLGFKLDHQHLPAFASVSLGELKILISGREASGSRPLPGGTSQEPGGSNRVVLRVSDLASSIRALTQDGVPFRNTMESGPGGKQIQIEDPDGNAIELFEPQGN